MKIAMLTAKNRFDTFCDKTLIPADTELMFLGTDYTEEEAIAKLSGGDVRTALNTLELAVLTTSMDANGKIVITKEN